jgi:galactonate dehydratase
MTIDQLQTVAVDVGPERTWLFVEVRTDEGLIGVGECSQSGLDEGVITQIDRLARLYLGQNPLDLIERRQTLLQYPASGRILHAAVSGLEQALWDLCGKALGVPCYQLLGGRVRDEIPLYANVTLAALGRVPEEYATLAHQAVKDGFRAVKFDLFDGSPLREGVADRAYYLRHVDLAVARVQAVREAVGSDIDIMTDWAYCVPVGDARRLAERLAQFNISWIEAPFVTSDPSLLADLRRDLTPRLCLGETLLGRKAFRPLLDAHAVDVIMPDVKWCGGILEARKIAAMAEVYEVEVSPHNMSGPVSTAAAVHLCATLPNFLSLEYCWGVPLWRGELVAGSERVVNGCIPVPTEPGLSVQWDPAAARKRRSSGE